MQVKIELKKEDKKQNFFLPYRKTYIHSSVYIFRCTPMFYMRVCQLLKPSAQPIAVLHYAIHYVKKIYQHVHTRLYVCMYNICM